MIAPAMNTRSLRTRDPFETSALRFEFGDAPEKILDEIGCAIQEISFDTVFRVFPEPVRDRRSIVRSAHRVEVHGQKSSSGTRTLWIASKRSSRPTASAMSSCFFFFSPSFVS